MVKLSKEQTEDMETVREKAKAWLKTRSWAKYKQIKRKVWSIADDYPSLNDFEFSNWWIRDLKKRAGVGKITQKQEDVEQKMLKWLKHRNNNPFLVGGTTTARVRIEWEKFARVKPSRTSLSAFRRKFKIKLAKNALTGNQDIWKLE